MPDVFKTTSSKTDFTSVSLISHFSLASVLIPVIVFKCKSVGEACGSYTSHVTPYLFVTTLLNSTSKALQARILY